MFFHIRTVVANIKLFICTVYDIYFVNWMQAFVLERHERLERLERHLVLYSKAPPSSGMALERSSLIWYGTRKILTHLVWYSIGPPSSGIVQYSKGPPSSGIVLERTSLVWYRTRTRVTSSCSSVRYIYLFRQLHVGFFVCVLSYKNWLPT